jgi:hypothetical protein
MTAAPQNVAAWRPIGGRWRATNHDFQPSASSEPSEPLLLVVEITQAELDDLLMGRVPRAAWVRIERARDAGVVVDTWGMDPLPSRCTVSNRGRHGSVKVKTAPVVLPDPIIRPNGVAYYPRTLMGNVCVEMVRKLHAEGRSVGFHGAPGTGKTACLEAAFTVDGRAEFEYVPGTADTEAADFVGTYVPEPGGTYRWVDGPLLRAMERGVPLLVDEIALIDPRAMSIVYAAMDGRRECYVTANPLRGTVKALPGFGLHSACNPDAPGALLSEALMSRHTAWIEYGTDYQLAEQWVPAAVVATARNLDRKRLEGEITWSPQMRELLAFAEMARLFGEPVALANLVGSAPAQDRPVVADTVSRMHGSLVEPLRISDAGGAS